MRKSPNSVIVVCATLVALAVLASYVYLSANEKDAAEISRFVNTVLNFIAVAGIATTGVVAGAAAKSAGEAKDAVDELRANGVKTVKNDEDEL